MNKLHIIAFAVLTLWTGQSQAQTIFNLTGIHPLDAGQATVLLDFNNDGLINFVTANKLRIGFALNQGDGLFQNFDTAQVNNANGFGIYDLNDDGIVSLYNTMGQLMFSEPKTGSQFSMQTAQLNTRI